MTDAPTVVVADAREQPGGDVEVDVQRWERLARDVLTAVGAAGELTLTFVDEADMADLNAEHMGKDGPTDVLAFPLDDEPMVGVPTLLGDVVVAPSVAAEQFPTHAGTYDDELALLIVHGILHIMGHDHAEAAEAAEMRTRELELLTTWFWDAGPPPGFRQDHAD